MNAVTDNPPASLERLLLVQRSAFEAERYPSVATRRDRLERLRRIVTQDESRFVAAIERDFGHRSAHETRLAELYIVGAEARHAIRRLSRWMKPRRVATPWHLLPASARIMHQPVGVVGIISPWNYPVQLALAPAVAAIAAGNRVMLKPSELTPATSSLLAELVSAPGFDVAGFSASWGSIYDSALLSIGANDDQTWQYEYGPILTTLAAAGTGPACLERSAQLDPGRGFRPRGDPPCRDRARLHRVGRAVEGSQRS